MRFILFLIFYIVSVTFVKLIHKDHSLMFCISLFSKILIFYFSHVSSDLFVVESQFDVF